jgi:hypothetical protein
VTDEAQSPSPADHDPVTQPHPQVTPSTAAPTGGAPATGPAQTRPPLPPPVPPVVETGPVPGPSVTDKIAALVDERPEVGAGGAFAGGIVLALILKRLGR